MISAAILAGGLATRLRPFTAQVPKSLLDVNGEPFIAHQLRLLRSNGIGHVVLCLGYLGHMVEDAVGDGSSYGIEVEYSFDGPNLLGTAGAVKKAIPKLGNSFFVLYGDSYLPCNYMAVAGAFARSGKLALMTVFRNHDRWDSSNVEMADGNIVAYDKKSHSPRMDYIDYGLGVFDCCAFAEVPDGRSSDLADLYSTLVFRGEVAPFEVTERFYEIGSVQGWKETATYLSKTGNLSI
jgi:NDP-sugar pyrophosphorylase family protein